MKRRISIALGLSILCTGIAFAQNYVHRVVFLNEGHYDYVNSMQTVPVTLGTYDPASQTYSVAATISSARFGSDILIDGQSIYVAADSFIVRYDKDTYAQTGIKVVQGLRKLAVWNNHLLVSRGDALPFASYFQVYDKNSLSLVYELDTITGPKYSAEGIVVYNDSAYLAINNAFSWGNEKGFLGIIDLVNEDYVTEIDLGPNGKNPDNVMRDGNMIYTLNNKDFSSSSISTYNATNRVKSTIDVAVASGCGTSAFAASFVYFQEYSLNRLARFDVNSQVVFDTLGGTLSFYGLQDDTINNILYATSTDFLTSGKAYIMQYNGAMLDSFAVGVAPGNMVLDIRTATGVEEQDDFSVVSVYPNPVSSELQVQFRNGVKHPVMIYNSLGELVHSCVVPDAAKIRVTELTPGIYYLRSGASACTFIKQ